MALSQKKIFSAFFTENPIFWEGYMRKRKTFHLSRNFIHRRKNRPSGVFYHSAWLSRYRCYKKCTSLDMSKKHGFRVLRSMVCMHDKKFLWQNSIYAKP